VQLSNNNNNIHPKRIISFIHAIGLANKLFQAYMSDFSMLKIP